VEGAGANRVSDVRATDTRRYGVGLIDVHASRLERLDLLPLSSERCNPGFASAGIACSTRTASILNSSSQLTDYGILIVGSDCNVLTANQSAPFQSDGNNWAGIGLFDADHNRLTDNVTSASDDGGIDVVAGSSAARLIGNTASWNGDDCIEVDDPATTLSGNTADHNNDLRDPGGGGVRDGGGNTAAFNDNPLQCIGVVCW
jgi:parallel beta-helix repeat protein